MDLSVINSITVKLYNKLEPARCCAGNQDLGIWSGWLRGQAGEPARRAGSSCQGPKWEGSGSSMGARRSGRCFCFGLRLPARQHRVERGAGGWREELGSLCAGTSWCSQAVTRTLSCHVQNGTDLQGVLQNCPWPMSGPGKSDRGFPGGC